YLLSGGGRASDWVQNAIAEPEVRMELDGVVRAAHARVIDSREEAERARSLVFEKDATRSCDDVTDWRDRALPVAIDVATYGSLFSPAELRRPRSPARRRW